MAIIKPYFAVLIRKHAFEGENRRAAFSNLGKLDDSFLDKKKGLTKS